MQISKFFTKEEDGAVTVDFVVLIAGVMLLGTFIVGTVSDGLFALSSKIDSALSTQSAG